MAALMPGKRLAEKWSGRMDAPDFLIAILSSKNLYLSNWKRRRPRLPLLHQKAYCRVEQARTPALPGFSEEKITL